jgi:hypothetical protein
LIAETAKCTETRPDMKIVVVQMNTEYFTGSPPHSIPPYSSRLG